MKISDEMIRDLQKKVDVSYEEAERYLRKAKGDVDLAANYIFENRNSYKEQSKRNIKNAFDNFIKYRMIVRKKDDLILNMPIAILILIGLFVFDSVSELFFAVLIGFIIILVTESDFKILKVEKADDIKSDNYNNKEQRYAYKETYTTKSQKPMESGDRQGNSASMKATVSKGIKEDNLETDNDDEFYEITIDE